MTNDRLGEKRVRSAKACQRCNSRRCAGRRTLYQDAADETVESNAMHLKQAFRALDVKTLDRLNAVSSTPNGDATQGITSRHVLLLHVSRALLNMRA